jgi:hypothetical protein
MIGVLFGTLLAGCVEKFEANLSHLATEGLVVEGDIVSDSTVVFKLSKTLPLTATGENEDLFANYRDVNAQLSVKGSDGTSWAGLPWGMGEYRVAIGTLQPEVEYHLEIQYDGDTYQSAPQKPLPCTPIEKLHFVQPELEGPVHVLLDTEEGEGTQYFLWYFEEDWEVRAHFQTMSLYDPELKWVMDYSYPPVAQGWCKTNSDQFLIGTTESMVADKMVGKTIRSIDYTDRRLSVLYSIRVHQRNLTLPEYEYYSVRAKQNNEMGGLFTPQPSELPTNITCSNPLRKVIGYVGCNMAVAQRQLYIPEEEVFFLDTSICDIGKAPAGSNHEKFIAGFQVSDKTPDGVLEWANIKCVDVRYWKADPMGRPSWWPNPYLYYQETPDYGGF